MNPKVETKSQAKISYKDKKVDERDTQRIEQERLRRMDPVHVSTVAAVSLIRQYAWQKGLRPWEMEL
jgi:hypothetical protein